MTTKRNSIGSPGLGTLLDAGVLWRERARSGQSGTVDSERDDDGEPWWGSGLAASAYGAAGLVAVVASRRVPNPWSTVLALTGAALGLIAAWILLWFVVFLVGALVDDRSDWSPWVIPTIGVVIVVLGAWIALLFSG